MKKRVMRRILILAVMCPPLIGVTKINDDEKHAGLRKVGARIVIHGSPSYLDLNPSF